MFNINFVINPVRETDIFPEENIVTCFHPTRAYIRGVATKFREFNHNSGTGNMAFVNISRKTLENPKKTAGEAVQEGA